MRFRPFPSFAAYHLAGGLALLLAVISATANSRADERQATLAAAVESISTPELRHYVEVLSNDTFEGRAAGSRGGRAAAGYIVQALERLKLKPAGPKGTTYLQPFGNQYQNILALLEGSDPELRNEIVLVGAHYDHVGYGNSRNSNGPVGFIHNGADDNGSGTAGLLEIAEAFTRLEPRPRRSVLFAFWDCEENELAGSSHWVRNPTVPRDQIAIALNLDMIGRLKNKHLEVIGSRTTTGLRRITAEQNVGSGLSLDYVWELKRNSDHHSFFSQGIPVLMFHTGLHNDYHRPSDDAEKLNYDGLCEVTRLTFASAYALANQTTRPRFRDASRRETPALQTKMEEALPPPAGRLGVAWDQTDMLGPGLRILRVDRQSAAERAGLKAGDRLVEFAGTRLEPTADLRPLVLAAVNPVSVIVERAGAEEPLPLTLTLTGEPVRLGISWREDDAQPGTLLLVQVVPGSPADLAGIRPMDRLYRIDGRPFAQGEEFRRMVGSTTEGFTLTAERRGQLFDVVIPKLAPVEQAVPLEAEKK